MNEADRIRLEHMLKFANEVVQFMEGRTRESLDSDPLLVRGISMSIGLIGEAAANVSQTVQEATPHLKWRLIIGMRNFLIHKYFRLEHDILWETATTSVPELIAQIEALLSSSENKGQ